MHVGLSVVVSNNILVVLSLDDVIKLLVSLVSGILYGKIEFCIWKIWHKLPDVSKVAFVIEPSRNVVEIVVFN